MGKLTAKQVKDALKVPGAYQDGDGLFLRVDKRGGASWYVRVQRDGKRRDISLGSAKLISLAEAAIKKMHGPAIHQEALNTSIRDAMDKLVADHKLRPATQPQVALGEGYEEGKDAELTVSLEILPTIAAPSRRIPR